MFSSSPTVQPGWQSRFTPILSELNQQRYIPTCTGSSSVLGSCLHAGGLCWQLSRSISGRKVWQWQDRGGGPATRETAAMEKVAQCVLRSLSYVQAKKKHNTAGQLRYKLVVQLFTIASHHSAPAALLCWQQNARSPSGICCPSSSGCTSICLRKATWEGSVLAGTAQGTWKHGIHQSQTH